MKSKDEELQRQQDFNQNGRIDVRFVTKHGSTFRIREGSNIDLLHDLNEAQVQNRYLIDFGTMEYNGKKYHLGICTLMATWPVGMTDEDIKDDMFPCVNYKPTPEEQRGSSLRFAGYGYESWSLWYSPSCERMWIRNSLSGKIEMMLPAVMSKMTNGGVKNPGQSDWDSLYDDYKGKHGKLSELLE